MSIMIKSGLIIAYWTSVSVGRWKITVSAVYTTLPVSFVSRNILLIVLPINALPHRHRRRHHRRCSPPLPWLCRLALGLHR